MNTDPVYYVRFPDGRRLGRTSLTGELGPVAPGFAYSWALAEATDLARIHGAEVHPADALHLAYRDLYQRQALAEGATPGEQEAEQQADDEEDAGADVGVRCHLRLVPPAAGR